MSDLKPCPFCGSEDLVVHNEINGAFIVCNACCISFDYGEATCVEDCIEAWNRRANDENVSE